MAAKNDELVEINQFLEEMIELIDMRLKKQEKRIAGVEADAERLRYALKSMQKNAGRNQGLDKSVMRVLKQ